MEELLIILALVVWVASKAKGNKKQATGRKAAPTPPSPEGRPLGEGLPPLQALEQARQEARKKALQEKAALRQAVKEQAEQARAAQGKPAPAAPPKEATMLPPRADGPAKAEPYAPVDRDDLPEGVDPCHPAQGPLRPQAQAHVRPAPGLAPRLRPAVEAAAPMQAAEEGGGIFTPQELRKAVVMSEILTRPCQRRRPRL